MSIKWLSQGILKIWSGYKREATADINEMWFLEWFSGLVMFCIFKMQSYVIAQIVFPILFFIP